MAASMDASAQAALLQAAAALISGSNSAPSASAQAGEVEGIAHGNEGFGSLSSNGVSKKGVMAKLYDEHASEFFRILASSKASEKLEDAARSGHTVTLYAPVNTGLKSLANYRALVKDRQTKAESAITTKWVRAHAALNVHQAAASTRYASDNQNQAATFKTMNGAFWVSHRPQAQGKEVDGSMGRVVVHDGTNAFGRELGESHVIKYSKVPGGHELYLVGAPLWDAN